MATLYTVDGTIKEVTPSKKKKFSLEELQGFVDGYIEVLRLTDKKMLVVNEEGIFQGLPFNKSAMYHIANEYGVKIPNLVGDVLVITKSEIR